VANSITFETPSTPFGAEKFSYAALRNPSALYFLISGARSSAGSPASHALAERLTCGGSNVNPGSSPGWARKLMIAGVTLLDEGAACGVAAVAKAVDTAVAVRTVEAAAVAIARTGYGPT